MKLRAHQSRLNGRFHVDFYHRECCWRMAQPFERAEVIGKRHVRVDETFQGFVQGRAPDFEFRKKFQGFGGVFTLVGVKLGRRRRLNAAFRFDNCGFEGERSSGQRPYAFRV